MKIKFAYKPAALVLCALLLAGCGTAGSSNDSTKTTNSASVGASPGMTSEQTETFVWKESRPETDGSFSLSDLRGMFSAGDAVYLWCVTRGEDWNNQTLTVARISPDTISEEILRPEQIYTHKMEGGDVQAVCADEDGAVYACLRRWEVTDEAFLFEEGDFMPQEMPDGENAISEITVSEESADEAGLSAVDENDEALYIPVFSERSEWHEITAFAPDGSVVYTQRIGQEESAYYYGEASMVCVDDALILSDVTGVNLYDKADGSFRANIWKPSQENFYGSMTVNLLADGTPVMYGYAENGEVLCEIDVTAQKQGKERTKPQMAALWKLSTGVSHDFYQEDNGVIRGFKLDEDDITDVLTFSDSDLLIHDTTAIVEITPEMLLLVHNEAAENYQGRYSGFGSYGAEEGQALSLLTKIDASTLPERIELTLATTYRTTPLTSQVARFNRENETYRIRLVDYSQYNTELNWMGGRDQLNKDMISGNLADMVALDPDMPNMDYFSKGVFLPLDDYLEGEAQITGLLENVYGAYQYDGKNYVVIPSFQASLVVAKKSLVLDLATWTPADVERIVEENNMKWGELFGFTESRDQILMGILRDGADSFIDRTKHTCDFHSEKFIDLLEFTMHFPSWEEYESMMEDFDWNRMETMWRANEALLNMIQMQGFDGYQELRYFTFGEEFELVGYPLGEKGAGCVIQAEEQIAINAKTEHKDACWEFLRAYLLPSYQENIKYGFPVTEDALEKKAAEARKPMTWTDEEGVEHEMENTRMIGDQEIEIPTLTKEDTDEVIAMLKSVKNGVRGDTTVQEIIQEEVGAFYDGKKTAQEVAAIIQNRVQLYLDEQ